MKSSKNQELEKRLKKGLDDILNPRDKFWGLSEEDYSILAKYVKVFERNNKVDVDMIQVSPELYPELHEFVTALQGNSKDWRDGMAAFDHFIKTYPTVEKIINATEE